MKKSLALSILLCTFLCLYHVSIGRSADKPPVKKVADYSCDYYDSLNGKYYCVETSATCGIAHAYVKEAGSTATPVLIVLTLHSTSNGCQYFEGSLELSTGNLIVVGVNSCGCGSSITTHVFFVRG